MFGWSDGFVLSFAARPSCVPLANAAHLRLRNVHATRRAPRPSALPCPAAAGTLFQHSPVPKAVVCTCARGRSPPGDPKAPGVFDDGTGGLLSTLPAEGARARRRGGCSASTPSGANSLLHARAARRTVLTDRRWAYDRKNLATCGRAAAAGAGVCEIMSCAYTLMLSPPPPHHRTSTGSARCTPQCSNISHTTAASRARARKSTGPGPSSRRPLSSRAPQ